jgi:hypothetical protein
MKQCHVVTELLPLLEGSEFEEFCQDIAANGLHEPIDLWQGMIIDGRNRERACEKTGVRAIYRDWNGSAEQLITYVISKNLRRRHLYIAQRATLGVQLLPLLTAAKAAAKMVSRENTGRTLQRAAKIAKVGPATIWRMQKVLRSAIPKIRDATLLGQIPVNTASQIAMMPRPEQLLAKLLPSKNSLTDPRGVNFLMHARTIKLLDRLHETLGGTKSQIVERAIVALAKHLKVRA